MSIDALALETPGKYNLLLLSLLLLETWNLFILTTSFQTRRHIAVGLSFATVSVVHDNVTYCTAFIYVPVNKHEPN